MTTQRKNVNNEQFFTNFETAKRLALVIQEQPWFEQITKIVEPSAGDGAWLDAMLIHESYDIAPKHPNVKQQDFLSVSFSVQNDGKLLYVGNPPFGRMGKTAKAFMRKCASTGDYIAFILPASFAKITQIRQMPNNFHLVYQEDLLNETFRFERDGKKVATIFQIWEKRSYKRQDSKRNSKCDDFEFTTDVANSDLAICTHGAAVGTVYSASFQDRSVRTHRFIKIKNSLPKEEMADRLRNLDFRQFYKYTVGATCVSTEEIVMIYNDSYKN